MRDHSLMRRHQGTRSTLKGVQMLRFLLAGLITVAGVVLLFVASFGDPNTALRDLRTMLPVIQMKSAPTPAAPQVAQRMQPAQAGPSVAPPDAPPAVQATQP